jgi:HNH endonuclease
MLRAHRVAWFVAHGAWPTLHVLHRCDVPLCVNPEHLFEGTQTDNLRDMARKGRGVAARPNQRGELARNAKLTTAAVREIRALRGVEKQKALAERYGVAPSLIGMVQTGRAWAWLA